MVMSEFSFLLRFKKEQVKQPKPLKFVFVFFSKKQGATNIWDAPRTHIVDMKISTVSTHPNSKVIRFNMQYN